MKKLTKSEQIRIDSLNSNAFVGHVKVEAQKPQSKWKSRKLLLTLTVLVIATVLICLDKISGDVYLTLLTANSGLYAFFNVEQKKSIMNNI